MKRAGIIEKIYERPYLRVVAHLLFWFLLTCIQWYFVSISFHPFRNYPIGMRILVLVVDMLNVMLFYYVFVYLLRPWLFYRRRIVPGILATFVLGIIYAFFNTLEEQFMINRCAACLEEIKSSSPGYLQFLQSDIFNRLYGKVASLGIFISLLFTIALPLGIKMSLQAFRQQQRSARLVQENLQLELNFLKSQVNPHFLFNTLNNLYGLILKGDNQRSAQLVDRLSQFLRYSLYESNDDKVPIEKELQLLRNYEALEAIRLNHTKVQLAFQNDGSVSSIAPLLMVPVLENAFKYTVDEPGAFIRMQLEVKDQQIQCSVQNSFDPLAPDASGGGIGLNNFRKRLELYYPGRYRLETNASDSIFTVSLKIDSHE